MNSIEILNLFKEKDNYFTWQTEILKYNGCSYTTDRVSACKINKIVLQNNKFSTPEINLQILKKHFEKNKSLGTLEIKKLNTKDLKERKYIGINDYIFDTSLLKKLVKINLDCEVYTSKASSNLLIFDYKDFEVILFKTLGKEYSLNFILKK